MNSVERVVPGVKVLRVHRSQGWAAVGRPTRPSRRRGARDAENAANRTRVDACRNRLREPIQLTKKYGAKLKSRLNTKEISQSQSSQKLFIKHAEIVCVVCESFVDADFKTIADVCCI
jgi:hypothetical protein